MTAGNTPPISKTALFVAAGRALGAREPDAKGRNPDYLAEKFLGDPSMLELDHPVLRALSLPYEEAMRDFEVAMSVRMMTVRTRFIDEAFERAIVGGATQFVILGAGLDTYAYRFQSKLSHARVFEVDRPTMQAFKMQRVYEALGGAPLNLTYVGMDVGREDLAGALRTEGYDSSQRTFFIMEGLSMYLSQTVVHSVLRFVAHHVSASGMVLDFVSRTPVALANRSTCEPVSPTTKAIAERFERLIEGEPWVFGIPVGTEAAFLQEFGLEVHELLRMGGKEASKRYLTRTDGTVVGAAALAKAVSRMTSQSLVGSKSAAGRECQSEFRGNQPLIAQLAEAVVP